MADTTTEPEPALPPLPPIEPTALIGAGGQRTGDGTFPFPGGDVLARLHRGMVAGRRFDVQAGALARQGRLAVYPSSRGQEACQVGAALALGPRDWLFPTYRDSVALAARGVDPVEVLALFRGDRHSGYDPGSHRCAPQCTPLATNAPHAAGLAWAARRAGEDAAALVLLGDGATSEGDAHEAFNLAAVWRAPVVFLVQNNQWAISVPLRLQSAAPTLAHKAVGYGMPGLHVDGNDAAAVYAAVSGALESARAGGGPVLIEARTYRVGPHTNADDPRRYRAPEEERAWEERDPVARLAELLRAEGLLDDAGEAEAAAEGERIAERVRTALAGQDRPDPAGLFDHVYAEPPAHLLEQRERLAAEAAGEAAADPAAAGGQGVR